MVFHIRKKQNKTVVCTISSVYQVLLHFDILWGGTMKTTTAELAIRTGGNSCENWNIYIQHQNQLAAQFVSRYASQGERTF